MATLGSLIISLEANTAKFESAMTKAEYAAKKSSDNIIKYLGGIGAAIAGMVSVGALDAAFSRITTMESNLVKAAARLNTTAETLSSFSIIARKAGMDTDTFTTTLARLEKGISAAALGVEKATGKYDENGEEILKTAKAYDELGINVQFLNKLPLDQKLLAIAEAFKKNIVPADQVRVAMEMGGKGAAGLVAAFREGPAAMEAYIAQAKKLSGMTNEMAQRGAEAKAAASNLSLAWEGFAATLVDKVSPAITTVLNKLTELISRSADADAGKVMRDIEKSFGKEAAKKYASGVIQGTQSAGGIGTYGESAETYYPTPIDPDVFQPAKRTKDAAVKTGGGKSSGTGGEINRLNSLFDTLTKDIAKLSENKLSEVEANYNKTIEQIYKKTSDRATTAADLEVLAKQQAYLKIDKIYEDFSGWYATEMGDQYAILKTSEDKKFKEMQTTESMTSAEKERALAAQYQIRQVYAKKTTDLDRTMETTRLNLSKGYVDSLASISPYLLEQLDYKKQSLALETKLVKMSLDEQLSSNKITQSTYDAATAMQAVVTQAKKYSLEREKWATQGWQGGLKTAALSASETAITWESSTVASFLKSLPQTVSGQLATSFIDHLKGNKVALEDLGYSMAERLIATWIEGYLTKLMPTALQGLVQLLGIEYEGKTLAATTAATTLIGGGVGAGQALINAAITAASIISGKGGTGIFSSSAGSGAADILAGFDWDTMYSGGAYHSGGLIYAHGGLNLASDEVPIIAQTGERVLSRSQNREYENGGDINVTIINNGKPAAATAQKRGGGMGSSRELIITLDEMNAQLINAGSKTARAMDQRYNASPAITVRG